MTALKQYARLESTGLWRAAGEAQRRDVVVSFGDATLVISDSNEKPLSHWSLAAVTRLNPGNRPALFSPDGDAGEQLEIDDGDMIEAIEKVRRAVERARPHPGRLRFWMLMGSIGVVIGLGVFWLPGAMLNHTLRVVPEVKRAEIGAALLQQIERVAGSPCESPDGSLALRELEQRLNLPGPVSVYQTALPDTIHLPGGAILAHARIFEDHDQIEVPAGYLVAEAVRARTIDPLEELLTHAGFTANFRLLTTAELPTVALRRYAEALVAEAPERIEDEPLLASFTVAQLPSAPYAYALDPSGETTLGLIEADPALTGSTAAVLGDDAWVSLQSICGE